LVRIGGGADDDRLFAPRAARKLAAENCGDVGLDPHGAAVAVVRWAVRATLERADVAEGAAVLAAGVRVERPRKAHVLDRVERRLALDLEVVNVDETWLRDRHPLPL